jgi:hypothetical protein
MDEGDVEKAVSDVNEMVSGLLDPLGSKLKADVDKTRM